MESIIAGLLRQFETGRLSRRQLIQNLAAGAGAVSAGTLGQAPLGAAGPGPLQVLSVDHISLRVADYQRSREFYTDLFAFRVTDDTGTQAQLRFGESSLAVRNPRRPDQAVPTVDHVAYRIATWNTDLVKGELEKRGLKPRLDLGDASSPPNYVSFHISDPDGYDVQISGVAAPGDSQYRKV